MDAREDGYVENCNKLSIVYPSWRLALTGGIANCCGQTGEILFIYYTQQNC